MTSRSWAASVAEWKLFDGDVAFVSTVEFHADRERAPHLEQPVHRDRLLLAESFILDAVGHIISTRQLGDTSRVTVSDLGCGDGGLLQRLNAYPTIEAWGYDFQPSNALGWGERGVVGVPLNVFGTADVINADVSLGDVVSMTEVLEHLTDPHAVVRALARRLDVRYVVASSPHTEHAESHDECHAWAWDVAGYEALFNTAGFNVIRHETTGMFQVILAEATR